MIDAYSISMMIAPTVTSSLTATYATQSQLLTCTVRMYLQIIDDECVRPTNYLEATPRVKNFTVPGHGAATLNCLLASNIRNSLIHHANSQIFENVT